MNDQFGIDLSLKPDLVMGAQISITGIVELHRGPGVRFSVEPFIEDENGKLHLPRHGLPHQAASASVWRRTRSGRLLLLAQHISRPLRRTTIKENNHG